MASVFNADTSVFFHLPAYGIPACVKAGFVVQGVNLPILRPHRLKGRFPARCGWFWNVHVWIVSREWAFRLDCRFVKAHCFVGAGLGLQPSVWMAIMAILAHIANKSKRAGLMDFRRFLLMDAGTGSNPRCVLVCVFMFLLVRVFRRGFKNLAGNVADFRDGELDFRAIHVNGADVNGRGFRRD